MSWECMSFMIIGNHNTGRHLLRNDLVKMILYGENDPGRLLLQSKFNEVDIVDLLETKLLLLVSAITSNTHWQVHL